MPMRKMCDKIRLILSFNIPGTNSSQCEANIVIQESICCHSISIWKVGVNNQKFEANIVKESIWKDIESWSQ